MRQTLFFIILIAFLVTAGCLNGNSETVITSPQSPNSVLSDPSAPASDAEKYCLDVSEGKTSQENNVLAVVTGTIKSNCNYPVEGKVQLFAYDKNGDPIPGFSQTYVQDSQQVLIKPGQTKSYSLTFDMRRVPDNPRNTDPSLYASFKVGAYVTRIVSARDAQGW